MGDQYSRRSLLGAVGVVLLGGCVEGSEEPNDTTDNTTQSPDGEEMNSTDDSSAEDTTPIPQAERQALVDQLPETSPLVGSLEEIVAAADREGAATDHDYEFRNEDHSVRVAVRLESQQELPEGYRVEVTDTYEEYVSAYVHVDDLVPLALEDAVRKIQRPAESRTHGGTDDDGL